MTYDVAFIGTGANPEEPSADGFAMAYQHATAYEQLGECRLVGCADIVRENAEAFAERNDIPGHGVYEDYEEMLSSLQPDVVSICTPPATHADLVVGTQRAASSTRSTAKNRWGSPGAGASEWRKPARSTASS